MSRKYKLNNVEKTFDLKEAFEDYGVDFKETETHFILSECPDCSGKDKLWVDKFNKMWVCFKCAETDQFNDNKEGRGNLYSFLQRKLGMERSVLRKMYAESRSFVFTGDMEFKMEEIEEVVEKIELQVIEVPKRFKKLIGNDICQRMNPLAYNYLASRNVTHIDQILNFNLMYDDFQKRIVFPAINLKGQIVGYQSRDITERWKTEHPKCANVECKERYNYQFFCYQLAGTPCMKCGVPLINTHYPKSKNSQNFPKTEIFFNENNANAEYPIVIVEGPFDSINVRNSVACLGKVLSDTQFQRLRDWNPPEIVLYMDSDIHGIRSAMSIYDQISPFFNKITLMQPDVNKDPGDYNLNENDGRFYRRMDYNSWYNVISNMLL